MKDVICRMFDNGEFKSVKVSSLDRATIFEDDVKFGFLKPKNGVLTYRLLNRDEEIIEKNAVKAVSMALFAWRLYVPIVFRSAKIGEKADITVQFNSEEDDPILTPGTLAYMYYPLGSKFDGVCVVNTRYFWTNSGVGINMHYIDPINYPTLDPKNPKGKTWDLDQVLRHEFGHGVFGLPHSVGMNRIMSSNYGYMAEHLQDEDIARARSKAGVRDLSHRIIDLLKWYFKRSD